MAIGIYNPVGEVAQSESANAVAMDALAGKRVGLVCNHHPAIVELWAELEKDIEREWRPASIKRVAKPNISKPQTREQLAALAAEVDYVLVGVGA
jgi:hypothetical protein